MVTIEELKTGRPVAQGEVYLWLEEAAPKVIRDAIGKLKNFTRLELENGELILGHSETGHHHVLEPVAEDVVIDSVAKVTIDQANEFMAKVQIMDACNLTHYRNNDTHEAVCLPAGNYLRVLRREGEPEGWRRVAD